MELGKGEVRQLFWLRGGRYVLVCSDYAILVRERIE